jgi:hypothetical protein
MLIYLLTGIAAGVASALYLAYNYHPLLLNGVVHAAIFGSGLVAVYVTRKLTVKNTGWYLVGALPVHIAIHFFMIGDLKPH